MVTSSSRVLPFKPAGAQPDASSDACSELLGPSVVTARLREQLSRVGPHFRAVLLYGEPGCGIEAAARMLHACSPLSDHPFHGLDKAAAETAFCGGATSRNELSGIIFLPDAEHLSPMAQRVLLRYLRLRGPGSLRLVAYLQTDPRALAATGRLVHDLAELLGSIRLVMPPLRERRDDLPLLATALLARYSRRHNKTAPVPDAEFLTSLCAHDWPGNLPHLSRVLQALVAAAQPAAALTGAHLAEALLRDAAAAAAKSQPAPAPMRLDDVVRQHVRSVLVACGGNKLRAAETLGISRSTLYRMLDQPSTAASDLSAAS